MKLQRNSTRALIATLLILGAGVAAHAVSSYLSPFRTAYPAAVGTKLDSCTLCHTSAPSLNAYGSAYRTNPNFQGIQGADSDGDGFTNLQEIQALTFPGNAADKPVIPPPDTAAPTISSFAISPTSSSLTVSITAFSANDNVAVTGYMVTESATKPAAGAAGWAAGAPTSYACAGAGTRTLYGWAKDAAGNVSNGATASTTITLPPPPDTAAPTISSFAISPTSSSLTVSITAFSANDNVAVTGYLVTESATKPAAGAAGWAAGAPTSYACAGDGTRTLYGWAKDAAGNVSNGATASTTITLPPPTDTAPPTISSFAISPTSGSLTVSITAFSANDNVAVTGYLVTESATKPAAGAAGWAAGAPTSYACAGDGTRTLYGWAKDAAGNVSNGATASTTITLPPPTDPTPPTISSFAVSPTSSSLTVSITAFSANDNVAVTGYLVTESATKPAAGAAGWAAGAPTSYACAGDGTRTLYGWAKDAAGNVSNGATASTTITLPPPTDPTPPTISSFAVSPTSSSLTVSITAFSANDNVAVTGYLVTESATTPAAGAAGWAAGAPTSYACAGDGTRTLYGWAKERHRQRLQRSNGIDNHHAAAPTDPTPPTISSFAVSPTSSSLSVSITAFSADDNVAVTGYLVTESATKPAASIAGWTAGPPATYVCSGGGARTLYGWAKDAAGNVSAGMTASTVVTLTRVSAPAMEMWSGTWFKVSTVGDRQRRPRIGYLHIRSWVSETGILGAILYSQDPETDRWISTELGLHYISGSPLKFLCWFEYAGEFAFAVSMNGSVTGEHLVRASIYAVGIRPDDDDDDDSDDDNVVGSRSNEGCFYINLQKNRRSELVGNLQLRRQIHC